MQSLLDKGGGGQGGGIIGGIGRLLGGGSTLDNLGKLGSLGLGAAGLVGAGKQRGEDQRLRQSIFDLQSGALGQAEDVFNAKSGLRSQSLAKLGSALNRPTDPGLFRPRP